MKPQKFCYICEKFYDTLFRCRYDHNKEWMFLCQKCLTKVKSTYGDTYQYGGTKKLNK